MWKKLVSSYRYARPYSSLTSELPYTDSRVKNAAGLIGSIKLISNANDVRKDDGETSLVNPPAEDTGSEHHELAEDASATVLPKTVSRREAYIHDDEVKKAKSLGIGLSSQTAENLVFERIRRRSSSKNSLSELNVSLFNMHSTRLAERLLNLSVGGLCLVESSQNNALTVKEFVKKKKQSKQTKLAAYRATFESLFPSAKKIGVPLPFKLLFGDSLFCKDALNPLVLKQSRSDAEELGVNDRSSPVIVGTLPTPSQQNSMLESLLYSLIIHLCKLSRNTIFGYGPVEIITFLSASNYAFLLCGRDTRFSFLSQVHRHRSWLFNNLYMVQDLRSLKGFSRTSFSPEIPLQKAVAHEKKLAELNVKSGCMYAVAITPRTHVRIGSYELVTNSDGISEQDGLFVAEPSLVLLRYSFWINTIAKLSSRVLLLERLKQWFPKSASRLSSVITPSTRVADLKMEDYDNLFCAVFNELDTECVLSQDMQKHFASFKISGFEKKYAD